jgi:hypothetical protein
VPLARFGVTPSNNVDACDIWRKVILGALAIVNQKIIGARFPSRARKYSFF